LKFPAVAEKTANKCRGLGLLFMPHPMITESTSDDETRRCDGLLHV